jgi:hypothetical protein
MRAITGRRAEPPSGRQEKQPQPKPELFAMILEEFAK